MSGPDAGLAMANVVLGALVGITLPYAPVFWPLLCVVLLGKFLYLVWRIRSGKPTRPMLRRAAFPVGILVGMAAVVNPAFM